MPTFTPGPPPTAYTSASPSASINASPIENAAEGSAGYRCPKGLRDAIRTHGREACTVEIIDECAARDLDARERYWIHTLDTYRTGLNRTRGGQGRATRAIKEAAAKYRAEVWPVKYEPLYRAYLAKHGHLDVAGEEPIIGKQMGSMRCEGSFRAEFDAAFPGEFWASHNARMWTREYEPRYRAYLAKHGHLDVAQEEPIIGNHMHSTRRRGSFRAEFDAAFPGEFWASHHNRMWTREYEPRYRAYLAKHGHLKVAFRESVIGPQMNRMRRKGSFRAEFDASFPGEFRASHKVRTWAVTYEPLYRAYLAKHGHLDVASREPIIGNHMGNMRRFGSFRAEFDAAFPGEFWASHNNRMWTREYEPRYRTYLAKHGHLDVALKAPVIGRQMNRMRTKGSFRAEFDAAFPGEFWARGGQGRATRAISTIENKEAAAKHRAQIWPVKYEPLYRAYLAKHGHLDVASREPIIGTHMSRMRSKGCFRAEFDAAFPGEFWASHNARMWTREYEPRYRAYLAKHGHLDVALKAPVIGSHMNSMRTKGSFRAEFDAAFPREFWASHRERTNARRKYIYT